MRGEDKKDILELYFEYLRSNGEDYNEDDERSTYNLMSFMGFEFVWIGYFGVPDEIDNLLSESPWQVEHREWIKTMGLENIGYYYVKTDEDTYFNASEIRRDYNFIMNVVEHIESIEDDHHGYFGVHISSNSCSIQGTNLHLSLEGLSQKYVDNPVYFNQVILDTKLDSIYKACNDFIKWYTTQNQK